MGLWLLHVYMQFNPAGANAVSGCYVNLTGYAVGAIQLFGRFPRSLVAHFYLHSHFPCVVAVPVHCSSVPSGESVGTVEVVKSVSWY